MVTLGILPTRPDTGYGYIQYLPGDGEAKTVKTFTEKPNVELAEAFLESGDYVWNAGIFIFSIPTFKRELNKHLSRMAEQFEEGLVHYYSPTEEDFIRKVYAVCKSISVDNGIMEKAQEVKVILADIGWSDLGTWKSLYEIKDKDEKGNVIDRLNKEDDDPNTKIFNDKQNPTQKVSTNAKQYTPIDKYKPTGNFVYNQEMFEKLGKKIEKRDY